VQTVLTLAENVLESITAEEYEEMETKASLAVKFRFDKSSYVGECEICGKISDRFGYISYRRVCSSCARKIARSVILATNLKKIRNTDYSKGCEYGYRLATDNGHGKETVEFISMVIDDAKKEDKTVHFLGRDMDVIFMAFNTEDNVNYLKGWNRPFISEPMWKKEALAKREGIQQGDYVIDTGFVGSILNDIRQVVNVNGYLLSADSCSQYTNLHRGSNWQYRDWVCELEHFTRAREVKISDETKLPEEVYVRNTAYESGIFNGFVHGIHAA
jgi:hypothetical protein